MGLPTPIIGGSDVEGFGWGRSQFIWVLFYSGHSFPLLYPAEPREGGPYFRLHHLVFADTCMNGSCMYGCGGGSRLPAEE